MSLINKTFVWTFQEIAETAEALKEEKQRRKDKRSSSGHGKDSRGRESGIMNSDDFAPSSFASNDGQSIGENVVGRNYTSGATTPRTRYWSMNSVSECSESESIEKIAPLRSQNPAWKGVEKIEFSTKGETLLVEKYSSIGQNQLGGRVYAGSLPSNGTLIAISEWIFPLQTKYSTNDRNKDIFEKRAKSKKVTFNASDDTRHDETILMKQLNSIDQEMNSLQKLTHPNLVSYFGMSQSKCLGGKGLKVSIFQEFVRGMNLSSYLKDNIPLDLSTLRKYMISVLEVLNYVHNQNIVHRNLRDTSIYIESNGTIKVGDFSIDKRLREVVCSKTKQEDCKVFNNVYQL